MRPRPGRGYFQRLLESFSFAFRGVATHFRICANARLQAVIGLAATLAGWFLHLSALEWCVVVLAMGLVITAECFNSAIESLADALHPGESLGIADSKDMAAGAVLLASVTSVVVGLIVLGPKILARLFPGAE